MPAPLWERGADAPDYQLFRTAHSPDSKDFAANGEHAHLNHQSGESNQLTHGNQLGEKTHHTSAKLEKRRFKAVEAIYGGGFTSDKASLYFEVHLTGGQKRKNPLWSILNLGRMGTHLEAYLQIPGQNTAFLI